MSEPCEDDDVKQLELPGTRDPRAEMRAACDRYAARLSGVKGDLRIELSGGGYAIVWGRRYRKPK